MKFKNHIKILFFLKLCAIVSNIVGQEFYNIPDPECNGSFGLCTQADKDMLGYRAIKKIHESMDDDHDGQVELQETKEFMQEELQYKNGFDRQQKLHASDSLITVDELWKSWKYSEAYNWTTDEVVNWLTEHVKLGQYSENVRRNRIDGQFLPRLAVNENNYFATVMQIKDARHKSRIMIKATDLVLFGNPPRTNNLIKDISMISLLTVLLITCVFALSKNRKSQEQIQKMMKELDNITSEEKPLHQFKNSIKKAHRDNEITDNKLMNELNAAKQEAESLKKERQKADGHTVQQLKLAEQELDKVRMALRKTEKRLQFTKYQPPEQLVQLLNKTYDAEKELLEFKFTLIDKEKQVCLEALDKISKRQGGFLGALKIAHSFQLEEINTKLELMKCELQKCKLEKQEWSRRWASIDEIVARITDASSNSDSHEMLGNDSSNNIKNNIPTGYSLTNNSYNSHSQSSFEHHQIDENYNNNKIQQKRLVAMQHSPTCPMMSSHSHFDDAIPIEEEDDEIEINKHYSNITPKFDLAYNEDIAESMLNESSKKTQCSGVDSIFNFNDTTGHTNNNNEKSTRSISMDDVSDELASVITHDDNNKKVAISNGSAINTIKERSKTSLNFNHFKKLFMKNTKKIKFK